MKLWTDQDQDGTSAAFAHYGGRGIVYVSGALGGGTVKIMARLPDGAGAVALYTATDILEAGAYPIDAAPFSGHLELSGSVSASVSAWYEPEGIAVRRAIRNR